MTHLFSRLSVKKKFFSLLCCAVMITSFIVLPTSISAALDKNDPAAKYGLEEAGNTIFFQGDKPAENPLLPVIVGKVVNAALSVLGLVFLVLMLYAGILWLTSQGEDDKVKRARSLIFYAILGIIVVLAAYAISEFVVKALIGKTLLNTP